MLLYNLFYRYNLFYSKLINSLENKIFYKKVIEFYKEARQKIAHVGSMLKDHPHKLEEVRMQSREKVSGKMSFLKKIKSAKILATVFDISILKLLVL